MSNDDYAVEYVEEWDTNLNSILHQSFEQTLTTLAKKEMEDGKVVALVLRQGDEIVSVALLEKKDERTNIATLCTKQKHRNKGACKKMVKWLQEERKGDLYLETERFSTPHAIFEKLGFIPTPEKFGDLASTKILVPSGKDPICLVLKEAQGSQTFSGLDNECFRRAKTKRDALLGLSKDFLIEFEVQTTEMSALWPTNPLEAIQLEDIKNAAVGSPSLRQLSFKEFVDQLLGLDFFKWMDFQLRKEYWQLAKGREGWPGTDLLTRKTATKKSQDPQDLRYWTGLELMLLNRHTESTRIQFVPIVRIADGKLAELVPTEAQNEGTIFLHFFSLDRNSEPIFLFKATGDIEDEM